ncbi:MAG: hypothetical protein MJ166_06105 [Clostridia bacterium]|nr:hypothetical protein [Clostridia bacterium]
MLFKSTKDEALRIYERAGNKYNATIEKVNLSCGNLYQSRVKSRDLIVKIQALVNSIANTPKEFQVTLINVEAEIKQFKETEKYAKEALNNIKKAGVNIAAGVATGTAVASIAPTAMMWVATTFGTASTGTAISSLTGAVATKAALAWLGGGALSAGGAGVAGGQALLALAGPIGWSIAGASTAISVSAVSIKNKKIADEIMEEAKSITMAGAELNETRAFIDNLHRETELLLSNLLAQYNSYSQLGSQDYSTLSNEAKLGLGAMVNSTLSLAELLNKTVGGING